MVLRSGGGSFLVFFVCFLVFFGFRAPGRQEGRKEGTVFLFTSALETLAAMVLFAKP